MYQVKKISTEELEKEIGKRLRSPQKKRELIAIYGKIKELRRRKPRGELAIERDRLESHFQKLVDARSHELQDQTRLVLDKLEKSLKKGELLQEDFAGMARAALKELEDLDLVREEVRGWGDTLDRLERECEDLSKVLAVEREVKELWSHAKSTEEQGGYGDSIVQDYKDAFTKIQGHLKGSKIVSPDPKCRLEMLATQAERLLNESADKHTITLTRATGDEVVAQLKAFRKLNSVNPEELVTYFLSLDNDAGYGLQPVKLAVEVARERVIHFWDYKIGEYLEAAKRMLNKYDDPYAAQELLNKCTNLPGLDDIEVGFQLSNFSTCLIQTLGNEIQKAFAIKREEESLRIHAISDIEYAKNIQDLADTANRLVWLPPTMPKDLENVLPPIRNIAAYAQAALESDTLYNKQTQLRNAITQTQRVREGLTLSNNRQIAARFGRALETWEQVLGKELSGLDAREIIPNVYVAGSPLATASKVFKGRHDLFVALERELASHAEQRPTLLLFGARRSGKTSAIKQMPVRLGPDVIPVEVDLQSAATAEDVCGLLFVLADQIKRNALMHRRVSLPTLTRDDLRADPYVVFGDWLNRVEEQVGNRWILLNLDEYEKLSEMIEGGRIDARVFDLLRGIIQHHPRITVLLSGSHTIDDVGAHSCAPLLSDYLINVRVLKIENLKEAEARELIVKPIEDFPLQYEPAAVERILAVTGCQPFLLQATCRDLVNQLNEQNKMTATQDDADRALESVLTTGVAYFQDLWGGRDSDDAQRAVMRAVATQKDVGAFDQTPLQNAIRKLVHRDILMPLPLSTTGEGRDGGWSFRVELVRRWVAQQP